MEKIRRVNRVKIEGSDSQRKNLRDEMRATSEGATIIGAVTDRSSEDQRLRGHVRITGTDTEGKSEILHDDHNLIVYRGRNWLMQRAFNQNLGMNGQQGDDPGGGSPSGTRPWREWYISWFGIGIGATIEGTNPLVVNPPDLVDYKLGDQIDIGGSYSYTIPTPYGSMSFKRFDSGYPMFLNDPELNPDGEDSTLYSNLDPTISGANYILDPVKGASYHPDSFLVAMVQISLLADEANGGILDTSFRDLNEAGLFISDSHDPALATECELFARVTFSTIRKTNTRSIVFQWYIYF